MRKDIKINTEYTLDQLNVFQNKAPLYIERIVIHKRRMELCVPFETSYGRFDSLVRLFPEIEFRTEEGRLVSGTGECSPLNAPWYDCECHRSVEIGLKFIIGSLTGKDADNADGNAAANLAPISDIDSLLSKYHWIIGHNIAKAGIEGAYWDAIAKLNGLPVNKLWGGTRDYVETGTSVGLEETPEALMKKIDRAVLEMKISRVKVKVRPRKDIKYIERIRKSYPDLRLQIDANAAYDLFNSDHISILKELDSYDLMMIEQPGRNDDILDHARQLAVLKTPVCLDESIIHVNHARQAVELWKQYSSVNKLIINIKPPRVGGYLEAIKIGRLCGDNGVSAWCGGMFESALGKTCNVHFSSRDEINLPGDHVSQSAYFKTDVADSPEYSDGKLKVPAGPGWGLINITL
ncbi:MAG: o-succinylbenzoate synthase [Syntrophothermus sp.]